MLVRLHISAKWNDVNTWKGEAEEKAASLQGREVHVKAGVGAWAVGAIVYTVHKRTDRHTDTNRSTNLIISSHSLRSIRGDNNTSTGNKRQLTFDSEAVDSWVGEMTNAYSALVWAGVWESHCWYGQSLNPLVVLIAGCIASMPLCLTYRRLLRQLQQTQRLTQPSIPLGYMIRYF